MKSSQKHNLRTWCIENGFTNLLDEWDYQANEDISPDSISCKSGYRAWWLCKKGHSFSATVSNRVRLHTSCPYCSGRLPIVGDNDLKTWCLKNNREDLIKEWDYEKNQSIEGYKAGSNKTVSWKCYLGHEWKAPIYRRTLNNNGCPYCSDPPKKILVGFNDFETWCKSNNREDLLEEWNDTKNDGLRPQECFPSSTKRVWWKCNSAHEWQASITSRTSNGSNCPYCAGQRVSKSNSLMALYPEIAKEWDYEKNNPLTPYDVGKGCIKKIWWKCEYGHEWTATVNSRVGGTGCPKCSASGTSIAEQGIAFYLKKQFVVNQRQKIKGYEIDIYMPEYKIGIEYDGQYYHSTKATVKREKEKDMMMAKEGITLLRVKETRDKKLSVKQDGNVIYFNSNRYLGRSYEQMIKMLLKHIVSVTKQDVELDVDIKRDFIEIRESGAKVFLEKSLEVINPHIASEWNYDKNGDLLPSMFSAGSTQKVWWKCAYGHEWVAPISRRAKGSGCPYCAGRIASEGENDLKTNYPELFAEWDLEKNSELNVRTIPVGSHKRVFWKCSKCNYEWQASLYSRTQLLTGCPKCARVKIESSHFRKVINFDTGEVFESVKAAAKKYNITAANISACCSGRRTIAGGFHWGRV